ncbi:hypothetical protein ACH4VX_23660 [Streptomyces sp. NPDC020731]|uniref:hypothetical protein n=1 Tax=Streptomyces sp. NPDC020731 TaxID=3365085 RepID=UPI0037B8DE9D
MSRAEVDLATSRVAGGTTGPRNTDMLPLGRIGIRAERGEDRPRRLTLAERTSPRETVELLTDDEGPDVLRTAGDTDGRARCSPSDHRPARLRRRPPGRPRTGTGTRTGTPHDGRHLHADLHADLPAHGAALCRLTRQPLARSTPCHAVSRRYGCMSGTTAVPRAIAPPQKRPVGLPGGGTVRHGASNSSGRPRPRRRAAPAVLTVSLGRKG